MQLLSKKQLLEKVPYSSQHILRLEHAGLFPRRIRPGGDNRNSKCFWIAEEIEDWIQEHANNSRDCS